MNTQDPSHQQQQQQQPCAECRARHVTERLQRHSITTLHRALVRLDRIYRGEQDANFDYARPQWLLDALSILP